MSDLLEIRRKRPQCGFALRSWRSDWIIVRIKFCLILSLRANYYLQLNVRPNAWRHFRTSCKLGLRRNVLLRTECDIYFLLKSITTVCALMLWTATGFASVESQVHLTLISGPSDSASDRWRHWSAPTNSSDCRRATVYVLRCCR